MAGQVQRYHAWPVLQVQSNAEHQWQVARIVLAIYPTAPTVLIRAALFHDNGEQSTGDLPFPTKSKDPALKVIIDNMEDLALHEQAKWGLPGCTGLTTHEKNVLKFADLMEMMEKGLQERLMGNRFAELIVRRTYEQAVLRLEMLPGDVQQRARAYMQKRLQAW